MSLLRKRDVGTSNHEMQDALAKAIELRDNATTEEERERRKAECKRLEPLAIAEKRLEQKEKCDAAFAHALEKIKKEGVPHLEAFMGVLSSAIKEAGPSQPGEAPFAGHAIFGKEVLRYLTRLVPAPSRPAPPAAPTFEVECLQVFEALSHGINRPIRFNTVPGKHYMLDEAQARFAGGLWCTGRPVFRFVNAAAERRFRKDLAARGDTVKQLAEMNQGVPGFDYDRLPGETR